MRRDALGVLHVRTATAAIEAAKYGKEEERIVVEEDSHPPVLSSVRVAKRRLASIVRLSCRECFSSHPTICKAIKNMR